MPILWHFSKTLIYNLYKLEYYYDNSKIFYMTIQMLQAKTV